MAAASVRGLPALESALAAGHPEDRDATCGAQHVGPATSIKLSGSDRGSFPRTRIVVIVAHTGAHAAPS
ncbi:MAG: hypothetical protein ACRDLS_09675, partial [Solirubrobacteraceae bacterium]